MPALCSVPTEFSTSSILEKENYSFRCMYELYGDNRGSLKGEDRDDITHHI